MDKNTESSQQLKEFLDFLQQLIGDYQYHLEAMKVEDKRSQDLLHEIELGPSKNKDRVATKLRKSRKARRVHKDYVEIHQALYDFITSQRGKDCKHDLEAILGTLRREERRKINRIYIPKVKDETQ